MAAETASSWRDKLRPGSFRGVPFKVDSHDTAFGRRTATHEYPLRDTPYTEDLGRKAREYTLELLVIGTDYMDARDRLREALEKGGPGELVHPYLGTLEVCARDGGRLRESTREGGMARFTVVFVEAGAELEPDSKKDTAWVVDQASENATKKAETDFSGRFSIAGPLRLLTTSKAGLDQLLGGVKSMVGAPFSELKMAKDILSSLWGEPSCLAGWITGLFSGLAGLDPTTSSSVALALAKGDISARGCGYAGSSPTSALGAQSLANLQALDSLVQVAAIASAARAASGTEYASADDALATRDAVCEAIENAALEASDSMYPQLADLRAAVVEDLGTRAAALPRLSSYRLPTTTPAVVIAHQLYGDATREGEITARNHVRHPGAVPGGTTLEVLADAFV
ncbi:Mu-like prophage DNA circulation protein [Humidesulfovibrio mexicanus]|uniref:Mu-like prophage DNA circulation protein n=1 Tax=Humidesulfovibrio mexicanus TaxID=147047 RepID=A0A239BDN3_9BACT|nr:DNA circularization N-terminal domain-containing protein [Humidesulfovibrio mexicanus]SNS05508.1 Mu-like prophage DNA circulation protein [Humidesulfovibrio mexicanus]